MAAALPIIILVIFAAGMAIHAYLKSRAVGSMRSSSRGGSQSKTLPKKGNCHKSKNIPTAKTPVKKRSKRTSCQPSETSRKQEDPGNEPTYSALSPGEMYYNDDNNNTELDGLHELPRGPTSSSDKSARESGPVPEFPAPAGTRRRLRRAPRRHTESTRRNLERFAIEQCQRQSHGVSGPAEFCTNPGMQDSQGHSSAQNSRPVIVQQIVYNNYFINCQGNMGQNFGTESPTYKIGKVDNLCNGGDLHVYTDGRDHSVEGSSDSASSYLGSGSFELTVSL